MPKKTIYLLVLPLAFLTISITAWLLTAQAAPADALPITSAVPWNEQPGEVLSPGQVVSYTFAAEAGQVAALDLIVPEGSLLEGQVTLSKASDGLRVIDDVYGPATTLFDPDKPGGLTAALPESGDYLIEIDPDDFGDGTTGAFILRFNLVDPASNLLVSIDQDLCSADTGFVRAATRAIEEGGQVYVCIGHYTETQMIRLATPNVRLASSSSLATIESLDSHTLYLQATDLEIEGLTLRGGTIGIISQPLDFGPDRLHLDDCQLEGTVSAIRLGLNDPADDVTISNCTIQIQTTGVTDRYAVLVRGDRTQVYDNKINTLTGDEHFYARYGILLTGDEVHVHDNEIGQLEWPTNTQWAIQVNGDRALVEENDIAGYTTGIQVQADQAITSTATVRHNHLYGDNVGATSTAILIGTIDDAEVIANFISGSPDLFGGIRLSSSGGQVVNNRVTLERRNGITYEDGFGALFPAVYANNTIVQEKAYPSGRGLYIYSSGAPTTMTLPISVTNNLLVAPLPELNWDNYCGVSAASRLQLLSNNLVAGFDTAFCATAETGSGGIWLAGGESPGLADGELHLTESSPAIDAGTAIGAPPVDFEGEARPQNQGFDIGADEKAVPADLSVTIAAAGASRCGVVNSELQYDVSVRNLGQAIAPNVILSNTVSGSYASISAVPDQGTCSGSGPLTCNLGALAVGQTVNVQMKVTPNMSGTLTNEVAVSSALPDSFLDNNTDSFSTQIAAMPASPVDLSPIALEVSQAVQNLANDVPLIEKKPAIVRLHARSDGAPAENVGALLYGWRDGNPLPGSPLSPMNAYSCMTVDSNGPARDGLQQTHLFDLPPDWRTGQVSLTGVINPGSPGPIPESNSANNEITDVVAFRSQPPICIRTYRVSALDQDGVEQLMPLQYLSSDPDGLVPRALSLLPTPEIRIFPESAIISRWAPFKPGQGFTAPFKKMTELVQWQIIETLWEKDQLSNDPAECDEADARTHYLGMVHPGPATTYPDGTFRGRATGVPFNSDIVIGDQLVVSMFTGGSGFEAPSGGQTLAHELGHNYGRGHTPCDDEGIPRDKNYPYDDCTMGPAEEDAFYGMDLIGDTAPLVITPTLAGDLMSYADRRWISDYQWRKIGIQLCTQRDNLCVWPATDPATTDAADQTGLPPSNQTITETDSVFLLSGVITDSVQFGSIHRLATDHIPEDKLLALWDARLPLTATTDFQLDLLDDTGAVLYTQPFSPLISPSPQNEALTFGLLVPDQANTAVLQVTHQGNALISRTVSANAPTVSVQAPVGGETFTETIQLAWQGNDADGDDLTYVVQYSADMGQTWRVLQADVSTTTLTVNAHTLPGSLTQSLIRIIANDGVNTGSAQSNLFSLEKHAPLVAIQTPEAGAFFDTESPITLLGSAFDAEDGWLSGAALTWSVDRLGHVGTGREVRLPGLPAGSYQITLTAADADGQTNSASVTIEVQPGGPQEIPNDIHLPMVVR